MKKKLLIIILAELLIVAFLLVVLFVPIHKSAAGTWVVNEITAGEVTMTIKDGQSLGISLGTFKLKKDGTCQVTLLEEKHKGTWKEKNNTIKIKYGERTATGKHKGKNIIITDDQQTQYKMRNPLG